MSLVTLLLAALIVCVATTIQSTLGFGSGLFLVSVGALMIPIHTLLPAYVPLDIVASGYLAWRYREHIHWRLLLTLVLPLMVVGTPLGVLLFNWTSEAVLKGIVGVGIGALSARALYTLYRQRHNTAQQTASGPKGLAQAATVFAAGVVHGATGTAGPVLIHACESSLPTKSAFRSTFCTVWAIMDVVKLTGLFLAGRYTSDSLPLTAAMFLGLPVGLMIGQKLHDKLPVETFRVLVYAALAVASCLLVASAL